MIVVTSWLCMSQSQSQHYVIQKKSIKKSTRVILLSDIVYTWEAKVQER